MCQHKSASFLLKSRLLSPWVIHLAFQTKLGQTTGTFRNATYPITQIWNAICPLFLLCSILPSCFFSPSLSDVARVFSSHMSMCEWALLFKKSSVRMSSYSASPSPREEKAMSLWTRNCIIEQGMVGEAEVWMKDLLEMEQTMWYPKISV